MSHIEEASELKKKDDEIQELKAFIEEIRKIAYSEQSTYHRVMDIKKKFPMK